MNKMKKIYKVAVLTMAILLVGSACDNGFEEMNRNPFQPTETSSAFLFNGMVASTPIPGDFRLYVWSERAFQWTQLAAVRGGGGLDLNAGVTGDEPNTVADRGINVLWGTYYGMLRSYRALEAILDADIDQERIANQRAMAEILLAYRTLQMTDVYGDMPFSEAGKGFTEGIPRPAYDTQESIYKACLNMLKSAVTNMKENPAGLATSQGNPYINFGNSETLYNNNMTMWKKLAQSLRLRYGLRIQNADAGLAQTTVTEAMAGPLFEIGEGLVFGPGTSIYSGFEWFSFQRMGTRIWTELNGGINGAADGSDIVDPRCYAWFEGNKDLEWVPLANDWNATIASVNGFPGQTSRNQNNDATDPNLTYRGNHSGFNWYTVQNGGNSYEHHVWGAEVALMKAEAALLGWGASASQAKAWYDAGVEQSIRTHWEMPTLHEDFSASALVYPDLTDQDIADYLANPRFALDGTNNMKKVLTQRWLNYFWNVDQAWALVRRTNEIDLEPVNNSISGAPAEWVTRVIFPEDEKINNLDAYNAASSRIGGNTYTSSMWWTK